MRDYVLTAFIIAVLPLCLYRPWIGVLGWYWVGLMNPHRLTWDFAYTMPFAMLIGGATLFGVVFAKDRRPVPWNRELILMIVLVAYFTFTTFFAWAPQYAWPQWEKVVKVVAMTIVATMLIHGRERVYWLLLVIALSIGFYGFKGGIWSILRGGAEKVLGPEGSFIDGNTFIGLAFTMVLPLIVALAREEQRRWLRNFLFITAGLTAIACVFTYSRGAWLGLAVVIPLMLFQLKISTRVLMICALVLASFFAPLLFPEKVFERADTISEYEKDGSANQRLMSWTANWNIGVRHPFTGGGFELEMADADRWLAFGDEKYSQFARSSFAAHSIYFQVLGQHGIVAFALYLWLLVGVQLTLRRLRRDASKSPHTAWIATYAKGIQIGLVGYMVSGAFLSSAYFDLAWLYYALAAILSRELALARSPGPVHQRMARSQHAPTGMVGGTLPTHPGVDPTAQPAREARPLSGRASL